MLQLSGPRPLPAALVAVVAVLAVGFAATAHAADPSLVIDAGISGNQANAVGTIENCISVPTGTEFQMDIVVRDVTDLLAWEMYLEYDRDVVIVTGQNVKLFQQANLGSSVLDVSSRVPDDSGFHYLAAFDSSDPPTPDSGTGVLARVTFKAVGAGSSKVSFGNRDIDGDGIIDKGPLLRDSAAKSIDDADKDTFFDGQLTNAEVDVGQDCPPGTVVAPAPKAESSGGSFSWLLAGGVTAAIVVVAGVGGVFLISRRKARRTLRDEAS